jgi:hypothetical protein
MEKYRVFVVKVSQYRIRNERRKKSSKNQELGAWNFQMHT